MASVNEIDAIRFELQRMSSTVVVNRKKRQDRVLEFDIELYYSLLQKYRGSERPFEEILLSHFGDYFRPYFDGRKWRFGDYRTTYADYLELIGNLLDDHLTSQSLIVDVGAGTGRLSRFLSSRYKTNSVHSLDKMPNSVTLINEISAREDFPVRAHVMDFNDTDFELPQNGFIVTSYSLMYLNSNNIDFFEKLSSSDAVGGLFLEPVYETLDSSKKFTRERQRYFESNNYNLDWYTQFNNFLSGEHKYRIVSQKSFFFAHNALLPISAILWKRVG